MALNVHQTHILVNADCASRAIGAFRRMRQDVHMAQKPHHRRRPIFLRQWREHRGKTLVQVAEHIHMSHGQLSRIERGTQPFNEQLLDVLADLYMCDPVDLLIRDPTNDRGIWSIWDQAKEGERRQITALAETVVNMGKAVNQER